MEREKAQAAKSARLKVPMRRSGADCLVVAMKRLEWPWSEGSGSSPLIWANRETGRSPSFNGRRQPSRDGTSRMSREAQVRCERLGVKSPEPTRRGEASLPSEALAL